MIGTRLGHYEIISILGKGGMGVVYRAKDLELGRLVALKVLAPAFVEDRESALRQEREARLLALLNHPNIAQIYGMETSGDKRALVMELVEGPTLAEHLAAGPLPLQECLSVSIQIVRALAEAHDRGIVHRDLKPHNIKLGHNGTVKVLDFGLARRDVLDASAGDDVTVDHATQPGAVLGTVGYMAPEQVRGLPVDRRADLFSFGCMLYEMATGQRAFSRKSPVETMYAILHEEPVPASLHRRDLSASMDRLIGHCLEKDAAARFQSAHDLEFAIAALRGDAGTHPAASASASVAVLPFVNFSADPENEFFADGITEDVIAHLAKVRSLKVISRTSVMTFKKRDRTLREIGEKLGAATLLEGSVRRSGNRVRIVAQLVDGATDEHIWAETYDRELTDIFAIQTDVALNIANALRAELSTDERKRIDRRPTYDLDAYEHYLRGRHAFYRFNEDGFRRSLGHLEAAVQRDPNFALAWASIAELHTEFCIQGYAGASPEETIRSAKRAAARALQADELAEAHGISGLIRFVFDFDWEGAEQEFRKALELSPGSSPAHDHYSWLCASQERYDDAVREVLRARDLDPLLIQSDVATTLLRAGRIPEALEEARKSIREEPGAPRCHSSLAWALIFDGKPSAGIAALEHAVALSPGATLFLSQLGQAYALTGNIQAAREILAQLRDPAKFKYVSPYHLAYVYSGLGQADSAIDCLEQAFERRSGPIYGIKGSFLFRNLRSHPRFVALLQRMHLA